MVNSEKFYRLFIWKIEAVIIFLLLFISDSSALRKDVVFVGQTEKPTLIYMRGRRVASTIIEDGLRGIRMENLHGTMNVLRANARVTVSDSLLALL